MRAVEMLPHASQSGAGSSRMTRNGKKGLLVAFLAVGFYATFGMDWSSDSKAAVTLRRQEEVGATFPSAEMMAQLSEGHCRGKDAGRSCCGERFQGSFILPLFPHTELTWPRWFRGLVYLIALIWVFLGVSILCDAFMNGIEAITQGTYIKKVPIFNKDGQKALDDAGQPIFRSKEEEVWNPSVANLSLMALGSSTPEILLNVIETCCSGFYSGDLGPGTIVGSASFNLFVITGLCCMALDDGESKKIDKYGVFMLTSLHSIVAYVWVVIIVSVHTKDIVEVWEALVTLAFMPWMIFWVYLADREWFREDNKVYIEDLDKEEAGDDGQTVEDAEKAGFIPKLPAGPGVAGGAANNGETSQAKKIINRETSNVPNLRKQHGDHITDENGRVIQALPPRNMTVAQRKRQAMKSLTAPQTHDHHADHATRQPSHHDPDDGVARVSFLESKICVLENVGEASIGVHRTGPKDFALKVHYATTDGTAISKQDYTATSGILEFPAGEDFAEIMVPIVDDDSKWNAEKNFTVSLTFPPECENQTGREIKLGKLQKTTVGIIDVDNPGEFCFTNSAFVCLSTDSKVALTIERRSGATGDATVTVVPTGASAEAGKHFKAEEEVVKFKDGQAAAMVTIDLLKKGWAGSDEEGESTLRFFVQLTKPTPENGARVMDPHKAEVLIRFNQGAGDEEEDENPSWSDQFRQAIIVENADEASAGDLFMHYATIIWKLLAAIIPPTDQKMFGRDTGGWATFTVAILIIGLVTTIINDLASIFGCIAGIKDSITAITLVALGTSLPDTIASMMSARGDTNADNSIGNITGSNSVNVFLGIGLPWSMAAIYWSSMGPTDAWKDKYKDWLTTDVAILGNYATTGGFVVIGGDLAFYTMIFVILACAVLTMLAVRRAVLGYELGGSKLVAQISGFFSISCWIIYIIVSILNVELPPGTFISLGR